MDRPRHGPPGAPCYPVPAKREFAAELTRLLFGDNPAGWAPLRTGTPR